MSQTLVACLTPPGSGAIATIAMRGPDAWAIVRKHFRSVKPLPDQPADNATWFGTFGEGVGDEVISAVLAVEPEISIEIHCHGGRQVVRWLIGLLVREGCREAKPEEFVFSRSHALRGNAVFDAPRRPRDLTGGTAISESATQSVEEGIPTQSVGTREESAQASENPWVLLAHAKTLRTAAILLDQVNGAFDRAIEEVQRNLQVRAIEVAQARLEEIVRYIPVGQHLIDPWRVVIAGAPNAGKSSLLNALAGYQRSVVAPVPGTTRDVVSATLAFDGWPVELSDTAGLREGGDELEKEGIEQARRQLATADLCLWVIDTTDPDVPTLDFLTAKVLAVLNKSDQPTAIDESQFPDAIRVSALTGDGIEQLIQAMVTRLVPDVPPPGAAVPYSAETRAFIRRFAENPQAEG